MVGNSAAFSKGIVNLLKRAAINNDNNICPLLLKHTHNGPKMPNEYKETLLKYSNDIRKTVRLT